MPDTALVIMARYPQVGTTKTRLARTIGDEETARLYRAFLTDLAHKFAGHMCDLHWAYTPATIDYMSFMATLTPTLTEHMHAFPQQGTDFGARLHHVFRWTHDQGFQRTIVIGSIHLKSVRKSLSRLRKGSIRLMSCSGLQMTGDIT